jgi:hypothetical protein
MKLNGSSVHALPFDGDRQDLENRDDSTSFVDGRLFGDHETRLASITETSEDGIHTEDALYLEKSSWPRMVK